MDRKNINRTRTNADNSSVNAGEKQSNITLVNRKMLTITGVEDIVSFDETNILMKTVLGVMSVDGAELHIVKLNVDSGDVIIDGRIDAVFYIDQNSSGGKKNAGSLFRRGR